MQRGQARIRRRGTDSLRRHNHAVVCAPTRNIVAIGIGFEMFGRRTGELGPTRTSVERRPFLVIRSGRLRLQLRSTRDSSKMTLCLWAMCRASITRLAHGRQSDRSRSLRVRWCWWLIRATQENGAPGRRSASLALMARSPASPSKLGIPPRPLNKAASRIWKRRIEEGARTNRGWCRRPTTSRLLRP
jgi:hypothetical protein